MSSLIAPVATIDHLEPHPNADRLALAHILGWQMIVPKDQYTVGDRVVYIPIDTLVPQELSDKLGVTQYLSKQRVRCTRLRGEPSFGLAIPPDDEAWPIGENVAEHYGLIKYEPPVREMRMRGGPPPDALPEHPLFPRYTDIENLRNFPNILEEGEWVVVTEKIHGTNTRIGMIDGEIMAGSHRLRRKPLEQEEECRQSFYWFPYTVPGVRTFLEASVDHGYKQVVLYGEVYGPSVQSFSYGLHQGELGYRCFDILVDGKYLDYSLFVSMCDIFAIPMVPFLKKFPFSLDQVRALSQGTTEVILRHAQAGNIREGVVVKPLEERTHPKVGRCIFKYVSDDYLFSKKSDYQEV